MADYQRILSYLYRYEKAEKKECFGFVKAEQKSGSLKLTIQIDDRKERLEHLRDTDVKYILNCCSDVSVFDTVIDIVNNFDFAYGSNRLHFFNSNDL